MELGGGGLHHFMKMLLCLFSLFELCHPVLLHVLLLPHKLHDAFVLGLHPFLLHASPLGLLSLKLFDVVLSGSDFLQSQLSLPFRETFQHTSYPVLLQRLI